MYAVSLKCCWSEQVPINPTFHFSYSDVTVHTRSGVAEKQTSWLELSFCTLQNMDRTGYPPGYAGSIKNQLGACPSMLQHVQRLLSDLNPLHRVELYSLKKGEPDLVSSNSLK